MTWVMNLVMFIMLVPSVILLYAIGFSKKPGRKNLILGVRDNPKFHEGEAAAKFDQIIASARKAALIITVIVCLISLVLLFAPVTDITMLAWTILVYAMFLIAVPFGKGNIELKNLKKELGITKSGTVYADLTSTSLVHCLNMTSLIIPNVILAVITIGAALIDFGVIALPFEIACGQFALTSMSASMLLTSLIILPLARLMDNTRNMVISRDSSINANYNRAKKKIWADLFIAMTWGVMLFTAAYAVIMMFASGEIATGIVLAAFTVLIMAVTIVSAMKQSAVEKRYERDTDLELQDDDDYWVLGMFYNNPNDTRLNVEKRFGIGGTINIAHPAGKIIMIVTAILIIGSLALMIWLTLNGYLEPSLTLM